MARGRVGRFVSGEAKRRYNDAYAVASELWPAASLETDVVGSFGSTRVRHIGTGDAPPLVLLHPLGATSISWHPVVSALAADRPVYALDTIGTAGRSEQDHPVRDGADFARWFDETLDGLGLDSVHVAGYSNGAWHAGLVAVHRPGRLATATFIEMSGGFTRVPLSTLAAFLVAGARPSAKNLTRLDSLIAPGVVVDPRETALARLALESYRPALPWPKPFADDELRDLTMPTLAVFGGATALSDPAAASARVRTLIAGSEVQTYSDASHGLLFERSDEVADRMRRFMAEHE